MSETPITDKLLEKWEDLQTDGLFGFVENELFDALKRLERDRDASLKREKAASDMLEALESISGAMDWICDQASPDPDMVDLLRADYAKIKAAIAKAKGKPPK